MLINPSSQAVISILPPELFLHHCTHRQGSVTQLHVVFTHRTPLSHNPRRLHHMPQGAPRSTDFPRAPPQAKPASSLSLSPCAPARSSPMLSRTAAAGKYQHNSCIPQSPAQGPRRAFSAGETTGTKLKQPPGPRKTRGGWRKGGWPRAGAAPDEGAGGESRATARGAWRGTEPRAGKGFGGTQNHGLGRVWEGNRTTGWEGFGRGTEPRAGKGLGGEQNHGLGRVWEGNRTTGWEGFGRGTEPRAGKGLGGEQNHGLGRVWGDTEPRAGKGFGGHRTTGWGRFRGVQGHVLGEVLGKNRTMVWEEAGT
ncbi:TATA-binding protein-associated factor 2N-like isoform X5 [Manacus candei]|uniref:TATA-binding protein-associated factor 2N-like isoform X5 n=1 Tax=Manacus candei TaxID=415023 RepID=UPI0022271AE2|nr:TATA-binding protein-associated factor 2N-like isoform X5 [Manacus candei]